MGHEILVHLSTFITSSKNSGKFCSGQSKQKKTLSGTDENFAMQKNQDYDAQRRRGYLIIQRRLIAIFYVI
jgi:hypothetical protein